MQFFVAILAELVLLFFLSRFISNALFTVSYRLFHSQAVAIHILAFVFLPGVIVHELAHAIMAKLLLVHVGKMEFWPKRIEDAVKLGSVEIGKTDPIRRALIGLAPIVIGLVVFSAMGVVLDIQEKAIRLDTSFFLSWQSVVLCLFVFEVSNTMFSSKKDLEGFFELCLVIGLLLGSLYVFLWLTGTTLPQVTVSMPMVVNEWLLSLSIILGVATAVNGLVGGLLCLLVKR